MPINHEFDVFFNNMPDDGSKKSGKKTNIHDNNGSFQFTIKVPKGEEAVEGVTRKDKEKEGNREESFPRQGILMADLFF